jgi:Alpha amylase, catalytic domain
MPRKTKGPKKLGFGNSHSLLSIVKTISSYCIIFIALDTPTASSAPSDNLRNLRDSDRRAEGGNCDADKVWVGNLALDGLPLYFPMHDPVAVTPADAVRVRFQMWPAQAQPGLRYRISQGAAYQPGTTWTAAGPPVRRNDPAGLDSVNNVSLEAVIPATGGSGPARVDYIVEGTLIENGATYHCEIVSNPFARGGEENVHSYVTTPKETGRIYQLMVRNFGSHAPPSGPIDDRVGYANAGAFCDITDMVLDQLKQLGVDTLWFSGIVDYDNTSNKRKGEAGSPYAVRNYYRASADLACGVDGKRLFSQGTHGDDATAEATRQFAELVDRVHGKGLRVMVDLVPNHTATVYDAVTTKVWSWEPQPIQPGPQNYQYDYGAVDRRIPGDSRLVFPSGADDWTDTYRLDYTNSRTAFGTTDPVTRKPIRAGNGFDNTDVAAVAPASTYRMLDRVVETWQARGVDGFRVDFPHALSSELWSYLIYNAKIRAAGFSRLGGDGAHYPRSVFIIGEGYDLDGSFGPDSGAIGNAGSSWANLLAGGFDGVYDKNGLLDQARKVVSEGWWANGIGRVYASEARDPFSYQRAVGNIGPAGARIMVRMQSNHDEVQPASAAWSGSVAPNMLPAKAATAAVMLLPGSLLMYNGHEVGEPAASPLDGGRTSFFDYVLMPAVRHWLDGTLDGRQQALRRYYARLITLAGSLGEASDPDGLGYYDLTQSAEWGQRPQETQRWIQAFARCGGGKAPALVVNNFSDHDQTVDLPLRPHGNDRMLAEFGIRDDPTVYTFTEALATENEDGVPQPLTLTATGAQLHSSGRLTVTVRRWTAATLLLTR